MTAALRRAAQAKAGRETAKDEVAVELQIKDRPKAATELEQGPSKPQGRPLQKGFADNHLPAQVGSLAPILGEDQEEKEEVLPGFSRCRPPSRVADSGPEAKVSHHLMLPLPSLRLCPPMCGLNPEPNLRPDLSPANHSSIPGPLMS